MLCMILRNVSSIQQVLVTWQRSVEYKMYGLFRSRTVFPKTRSRYTPLALFWTLRNFYPSLQLPIDYSQQLQFDLVIFCWIYPAPSGKATNKKGLLSFRHLR